MITVDCAFGSSPGAASYSWTQIHDGTSTGAARTISWQRGRVNELNRMTAGTGAATLKDAASNFDPDNTASAYYPNVRPMVPIRAQATIASTTYPLFQHFVASWPRTLRLKQTYTERSITTVDGFEWLAQAGIAGASYSQELSGTRVTNTLNTAGWSSALRTIAAGNLTVPAIAFDAAASDNALDHLLSVADSENGLFFIDASGNAVFVQRHDLVVSPYTVSQATFHDSPTGGAGIAFVDAQPAFDLDTTFNAWVGTRSGGVTQQAADSTSQGLYGLRTQTLTPLAASDTDVLSQVQWKLGQFAQPLNRLASVTVMPGTSTTAWQTLLGLEVGERITVSEKPPGFAASKTADYVIQQISVTVPETVQAATFTYGLWPASTNTYWQAALAGFSEAATTTRAAY